jgi:hypothetical protein
VPSVAGVTAAVNVTVCNGVTLAELALTAMLDACLPTVNVACVVDAG